MSSQSMPERLNQANAAGGRLAAQIPATFKAFKALKDASGADGALSAKVKELVSLGIAISARCDGCIAYHVQHALKLGATRAELAETIGVAITMGGGPSVIYGSDAWRAVEEFDKAGA
jgi:AhpD family alkylhydroperoxidase